MKKCEICKEREAKILFIHTNAPKTQTFNLCEECKINFLTQLYDLENKEVEKYLRK